MAFNESIKKAIEKIQQDITKIEESCASFSLIDADEIKEKAIDILNKAINKIEKVAESIDDQNEIDKVLKYVDEKSEELTKETLEQIEYVRKTESIKDKVDYGKEEQKDKTKIKKIVIKKVNKEADDISRQSISVLKEWFK